MGRRSLAPVVRATLHSFRAACLRVLMTSGYGCGPTGCSSTWQRRAFCGVRRLVGNIRSRMNHWPCSVRPVRSVWNLDTDLSMNTHITRTVSCCTTFTGCESRNESCFGWKFWRIAERMDLHHSTLLMTFTRWRRLSHGDGCVRRRLRPWSSQPQRVLRSAIALSLLLPLGLGTAEALGYVISVHPRFLEASKDSFIYSLLPIGATLFYVLCCHLV